MVHPLAPRSAHQRGATFEQLCGTMGKRALSLRVGGPMIEFLRKLFVEHWPSLLGALATFAVGRWWGGFRASRELAEKQFRGRLNISLNTLGESTLRIRTLRECNMNDVWFNKAMQKRVRAVADRTTPEDAILPFDDEERWLYLNAILNEVSEMFVQGTLRRDLGEAARAAKYVIALTNEKDGEMRTWKIRAMVVRPETLSQVEQRMTQGTPPDLESPHHITRCHTLAAIARRYREQPQEFLTMEIAV